MAYSSASITLIKEKKQPNQRTVPAELNSEQSQLSYPTKQLAVGEYDPLDWAGLTICTVFC